MSKYINADELIKAIKTELWDWETVDGIKSSTVLKQTISDIKNMPSADVVDVKHGEWTEEYKEEAPMFLKKRWVCSECGKWQTHGSTSFCPNCGADMRERKDNETKA